VLIAKLMPDDHHANNVALGLQAHLGHRFGVALGLLARRLVGLIALLDGLEGGDVILNHGSLHCSGGHCSLLVGDATALFQDEKKA